MQRRSQPLASFSGGHRAAVEAAAQAARAGDRAADPDVAAVATAWPGTLSAEASRSAGEIGSSRRAVLRVCAWWVSPATIERSRAAMSG